MFSPNVLFVTATRTRNLNRGARSRVQA